MTRRTLAALLGLTLVLLVGVVVPLGMLSAEHDRQVFTDRTTAAAAAVASSAEEQLSDHEQGSPTPGRLIVPPALVSHDSFAVYDSAGHLFLRGPAGLRVTAAQLAAALAGQTVRSWQDQPQNALLVLRPASSGSQIVGAAVVLRPARRLNQQIDDLWLGLGGAGLVAVLLAVALSIALARWVGRPLHRLDVAADTFGAGELTVRAATGLGPPETRHLAVTFNDMAGRIETLVASHRALVADVSHQLRTPLAAIRLRLELLHDDVDRAAADELTAALVEIARLSRLVDGLLALARAENTHPAPAPIDLARLVAERMSTWSPLAQERQIELRPSLAPATVAVTPGHLEQVLDNLLANALDATPDGGRIAVAISQHRGRVSLDVTDSGPGMTPGQRAHALRRFWSNPDADHADVGAAGTGLGLAIAHRLVTSDGGTIELTNAPGQGLTVRIELHAANPTKRTGP